MKLVIDASVFAKWGLPEEKNEQALKLRADYIAGKIQLFAPPLLLTEVGNVMWKAIHRKDLFPQEKGGEILQALWELAPEIVQVNRRFSSNVLDLALNLEITYYDALYLATGKKLDIASITADRELYKKAKGRKDLHVLLLEQYSSKENSE